MGIRKLIISSVAITAFALTGCQTTQCESQKPCCEASNAQVPTLTKEMFYKNGVFDEAAAKQAYFDMCDRLGYPVSENLRENLWVLDFGLGEFPEVGMGGIFWAHENENGVFGHEILLLPNQMLPEHAHYPHDGKPAKYECWQARAGETYCFGEVGEDASKFPHVKIPESQKNEVTVNKVALSTAEKGNVIWLNRLEAFHFQIAGPEGAVVCEYGTYHQNDGNRFTNKKISLK